MIVVSPKQMSKLRNGRKVRIKKPRMEGEGVGVIVNPMNYSLITKSFTRNKGTDLILSPEEILANREQAPTIEGGGIFGRKFDKSVEKAIGKRGRKKVYGFAKEVLNPIAKTALYAGIATGATALSAAQPELVPLIVPAAAGTADFLGDYLDKPSDFYSRPKSKSNVGGPYAKVPKNIAGQYLQDQALGQINSQLGTNMGNLSRAGIGQAVQDKMSQELDARAVEAQKALMNNMTPSDRELYLRQLTPEQRAVLGRGLGLFGAGLYPVGAGLGAGLYVGAKRGGSIVGLQGGLIHPTPQALEPQPISTNYQFRYTLPLWARVEK